jgi:hypothetical protein
MLAVFEVEKEIPDRRSYDEAIPTVNTTPY